VCLCLSFARVACIVHEAAASLSDLFTQKEMRECPGLETASHVMFGKDKCWLLLQINKRLISPCRVPAVNTWCTSSLAPLFSLGAAPLRVVVLPI